MTTVSVHEAKAKLSSLIARVEDRHEKITICRYGRAVAELTPVDRSSRTVSDEKLRDVKIHADLTEPTTAEWEEA